MKIGIGIDTGGTYTDAVIYDFSSGKILGSAKSLTTKNDLSVGILESIDGLPQEIAQKAEMIALSTTLATNACVEDKCGQAELIFFGGDPKIMKEYGSQYGLPPVQDIYIPEQETEENGMPGEGPDWDKFTDYVKSHFHHLDGVGIVEMGAMYDGAAIEKKAKGIFEQNHHTPVVCGHELFANLNCLQRGASTLLNAGLFPVITEFLDGVKKALAVRKIVAPLVIVRSDGSLMSEKFALLRPVETLLCGPAASVIGSQNLTGEKNCVVIDMGGTTTDIALIRDEFPVTVTNGIAIGKWKTFVGGLYVKTFGLGGDTAIHYADDVLYLEDYRIVPICNAASQYPVILENLKKLEFKRHTRFLYEHYILVHEITDQTKYSEEEKALCEALKEKPLMISEAAQAVGKDIYTLDVSRLLRDGVIQVCGLTPTDVMHLKGDFNKYNTEASRIAADFAAQNLSITVDEFCDRVYNEIKHKMYRNIICALLENRYPEYMKNGVNKEIYSFIDDNFRAALSGKPDPMLTAMFSTQYKLIGIGAPIRIFMDDVAKMLGTQAIVPQHYEVANALGAIVGSINASCSIEIRPNIGEEDAESAYVVFGINGHKSFEELEDAICFAEKEVRAEAEAEARRRGAKGKLTIRSEVRDSSADARNTTVYLGTVVTASAVGSVGFS